MGAGGGVGYEGQSMCCRCTPVHRRWGLTRLPSCTLSQMARFSYYREYAGYQVRRRTAVARDATRASRRWHGWG